MPGDNLYFLCAECQRLNSRRRRSILDVELLLAAHRVGGAEKEELQRAIEQQNAATAEYAAHRATHEDQAERL